MIRLSMTLVLFAYFGTAHAESKIDNFTGEYTAITVCDEHEHEASTPKGPHVKRNGKFIIAKYNTADGERAVIMDAGGFSDYDAWSTVRFVYVDGIPFDGIELSCEDEAAYTFNGRQLEADERREMFKFLDGVARSRKADGFAHLEGEADLHGDGTIHVIRVHVYGDGQLFMAYEKKKGGGIHAGHIHN